MLGKIYDLCFYFCRCVGRSQQTKTGVIINHIEDLGFEEYNELVKYVEDTKQIYVLRMSVSNGLLCLFSLTGIKSVGTIVSSVFSLLYSSSGIIIQ